MVEMAWERKKTKAEDGKASTEGPEHYQLVPNQYKGGGPRFPAMTSFGNIPCWDCILPKRSNRWLRPSDACHKAK